MFKIIIPREDTMASLKLARESISFEAGYVSNAVDLAKSYLPSMVANFKSTAPIFNHDKIEVKKLSKPLSALTLIVGKIDYLDIAEVTITVPEGFQSNLLKAFETSDKIIDSINEVKATIDDFNTYVAIFITNKDAKKNMKDLLPMIKKGKLQASGLIDKVTTMYSEGSKENSMPYKKLFSSNSEFDKAIYKYKTVNDKFLGISIPKLKETMLSISENLDTVIDLLKENKIENMSPESLKNLSEGSFQMGSLAESISIAYFKLMGIMNIVPSLENHITTNLIKD